MTGIDPIAGSRRWPVVCYAYALLVGALGAYFLLGLPVQLTDSFGLLIDAQNNTLWDLLRSHFSQPAYMRPFLWGQTKIALVLSGGHYYGLFRGLHALQFVALALLFVQLLKPRTVLDASVLPLALAVLVGIHTMQGTVREAFPINTFMTILLCCLAAANLALARPAWWVGPAAAALFVFAALTVESGLLVWVVFACAWLTGARGLSRRAMIAATSLMLGYFVLRFGYLDVGSPGLIERSSGYGFSYREPSELIRMFGDNPLWFYVHNVLTSMTSVLLAEPRGGIWTFTRGLVQGEASAALAVNLVASTAATAAIMAFAWRRRRDWLRRRFDHGDRLVVMFAGVLAANAAISYGYTKDVIMSPAGVFYAAAVFVAVRDLAGRWPPRPALRAAALAFCLVLAVSWSVRAVGAFAGLRHQVFNVRSDWADYESFVKDNPLTLDARGEALKHVLQQDAVHRYPPSNPVGEWVAIFDVE